MATQEVRAIHCARLMDTPSRSRAEAVRTGVYDWNSWLAVADWLEERCPPMAAAAVRRMVAACQTVTFPQWWLDFETTVVGKTAANPFHCKAILAGLAGKPVTENDT